MKTITRRRFIQATALSALGATLAACVQPSESPSGAEPVASEPTVEPTQAAGVPSAYKEAPMLAAKVAAGELPPIEERLPINPWIVPTIEITGTHGGRVRMSHFWSGWKYVAGYWIDRGLLWYDQNLSLKPRLAESFEVNDDATEYVFHLRRGTKWSDGHPFTAQDFLWYREHVLGNETLTPGPSGHWGSIGPDNTRYTMDVEAIDDYTVKLKFRYPNSLFVYKVNRQSPFLPSHFMKQWHPDTCEDPAALEATVKAEGVDTWANLFDNKSWYHLTPDLPMINGWDSDNTLNEEIFTCTRNPYFFGVDSEGNQLPYIDQLYFRGAQSFEMVNLWKLNGEIDFEWILMQDYPTFKEGEAKGGYRLVMAPIGMHQGIQLNMTVKDPQLRELFQKRETRLAVSYGVNRDEMNEMLYQGMGIPRQCSPISSSPNFYPKLSFAHIEYDPDKANSLLDEAGYVNRNADGYRTFSDGREVGWTIESTASPGTADEDAVVMVTQYLNALGLHVVVKPVDLNLYNQHHNANEIESAFMGGDRCVVPLADASLFTGEQTDRPWAVAWGKWKGNPGSPVAEEPPEGHWIRKIWEIWDQIPLQPNEETRNELFTQIMDIWAEELPMICFVGEWPQPVLMRNGFRNYVEGTPLDDPTGSICLLNPEQYTWEDPATQSL